MGNGVELTEERRRVLVDRLVRLYSEEFDEELSKYRAERLIDHFVETLAPQVYNQAVQDARAFFQDKLDDLDGDVHAIET